MASVLIVALFCVVVQALPTLVSRQDVTTLSTSQVDAFDRYTNFASAAYCTPTAIRSWSCGANCDSNAGFEPVASGGDGSSVQYWYVGYDPSLGTVIVAHQGTNPQQIVAVLTDMDLFMGKLDSSLFPGLPSEIRVHLGFRNEHSKTASDVLSSVQMALSKYEANSVTLVGHSLGAALSLLDSVYLPLYLPSGTTFHPVLYGLPRVGNQAFANYVDANVNATHVNNLKDPVPIIPPMIFGYVHPSGELHIRETGEWAACPGQDNPSTDCVVGDVPLVVMGNTTDHDGPYNGVMIHCTA